MERSERVAEEVRNIVADVIRNDIRDPRLPAIVSITYVKVTRDFSHANIYYSVYGTDKEKSDCADALASAGSYIRREIAGRIKLRIVPELHFIPDDSIERGIRISKLIDDTLKKDMEKDFGDNKED
ncbi:MAG: 30S ribosome-binding factor RbfA [Eubacteriales bacterium]|jgi:ribosome-binding factor A|nr:30S ribosome-binding factor RbfA [Eubacteriales bacterium]MDD4717101.1 30S ribosome-binding factor RbfA [Eubacteriales bacterium]